MSTSYSTDSGCSAASEALRILFEEENAKICRNRKESNTLMSSYSSIPVRDYSVPNFAGLRSPNSVSPVKIGLNLSSSSRSPYVSAKTSKELRATKPSSKDKVTSIARDANLQVASVKSIKPLREFTKLPPVPNTSKVTLPHVQSACKVTLPPVSNSSMGKVTRKPATRIQKVSTWSASNTCKVAPPTLPSTCRVALPPVANTSKVTHPPTMIRSKLATKPASSTCKVTLPPVPSTYMVANKPNTYLPLKRPSQSKLPVANQDVFSRLPRMQRNTKSGELHFPAALFLVKGKQAAVKPSLPADISSSPGFPTTCRRHRRSRKSETKTKFAPLKDAINSLKAANALEIQSEKRVDKLGSSNYMKLPPLRRGSSPCASKATKPGMSKVPVLPPLKNRRLSSSVETEYSLEGDDELYSLLTLLHG